jgi:hypothetical protein
MLAGGLNMSPQQAASVFNSKALGKERLILPLAANGPGKSLFGVKQQVHSINKLGQTLK